MRLPSVSRQDDMPHQCRADLAMASTAVLPIDGMGRTLASHTMGMTVGSLAEATHALAVVIEPLHAGVLEAANLCDPCGRASDVDHRVGHNSGH
jgi:hypothetical protein